MQLHTLFRIVIPILFLCTIPIDSQAEGSRDFIDYPGERLFFHAQVPQQLKAYAAEGEFLNFGASHVGITGGFITIYRPDGSVHSVFDNTGATEGYAIIYNHIEERAGPTGGGTMNGNGYKPGVIQVGSGEEGIWTFALEFPSYNIQTFINLQNNEPWNRAQHQPLIQRVITAWDITVSQNAAANNGGTMLQGRVYSNEYGAIVNLVSASTSPVFYVLTKDGLEYEVIFGEVNPWGFQINSSAKGILDGYKNPYYKSAFEDEITRVSSLDGLDPSKLYLWEPQAEDNGEFINNKIFFNRPSADLPESAIVTDIFRNNSHVTWLLRSVNGQAVDFEFLSFSPVQRGGSFIPEGVMDVDLGTYIIFDLNRQVSAQVLLDLNFDGDYDDVVDRALYKTIGPGIDTIFWDARNGEGNTIEADPAPINVDFKFIAGQGEIHIALADIEENPGGIIFRRLNGMNAPAEGIIYNHIPVGGGYSGGTLPYELDYTNEPFKYVDYFGNKKYLDYYSFEGLPFQELSVELTVVQEAYSFEDTDFDGIPDKDDVDDDNDGIPDIREYCGIAGGADCLPLGLAPWEDNDNDGIKNYLDNDDASFSLACAEIEPGVCAQVRSIYDLDGDGRPNHLDSDSDNDGIFDVFEAGHGALDENFDGFIDGTAEDFGANGFFNAVATDPSSPTADINYTLLDSDNDGIPNFTDLDSDNDGIPEVIENQLNSADTNIDGRLEVGNLYISLEEHFRGIPEIVHHRLYSNIPVTQPDQDEDGVPNHLDLDSDNDGIHDVSEGNYPDSDNDGIYGSGIPEINSDGIPSVADKLLLSPSGLNTPFYSAQYDFDGDLLWDFLDLDSDNDGMHDTREADFPDGDGDGFIGTGRGTTNSHGITIADAILVPFFILSDPVDWDSDGFPDYKDLDTDNDGINDVIEHGLSDENQDGFVGEELIVSRLGQVLDENSVILVTSNFKDQDLDDVPDFRDRDSDNDGIHDVAEARIADADGDAIAGQGVPILDDFGRPSLSTSMPGDQDADGILNFRDLDSDNDGLLDVFEGGNVDGDADGIIGSGTISVDFFGLALASGAYLNTTSDPSDADGDGLPDFLSLDSDGDKIPDVQEAQLVDSDLDGLLGSGIMIADKNGLTGDPNSTPAILPASSAVDSDNDGEEDFRDIDSDNDNLLDIDECPSLACRDLDQDGKEDYRDVDRDGDGILDSFECSTSNGCPDFDGDGLPNIDDLDSDNDQLSDAVECPGGIPCPDIDGSTIVDVYEFTCHEAISPLLVRATQDATYCRGTDITLTAENQGIQIGKINYAWTLPNGSIVENEADESEPLEYTISTADDNDVGIYSIISTALNGCTSQVLTVNVNLIDAPSAAVLSAESKEICAGGVIEIDANESAVNGLSYDWYFDDGNAVNIIETTMSPTLIIDNAQTENQGIYSMVINGPNCSSPPSNLEYITVKPFISEAKASNPSSMENPICGGSVLTLFAEPVVGANYTWSGPNGFSSSDQNPIIENIDAAQNGEYSYTIEIPGCQILASEPTNVFIQEEGSQPEIVGSESACIGSSLTLNVPNEYEVSGNVVVLYEWYSVPGGNLVATTDQPNYTIDAVDANTATTYYVEVSLGECQTQPSALFDFEIDEAPSEKAYIPEDAYLICEEEEITVTAEQPVNATGTWSSPDNVLIVTPNQRESRVADFGSEPFILVWSLSQGTCTNFSSDTLFVDFPTSVSAMEDVFSIDRNGVVSDYNLIDNDNLPSGVSHLVSIISSPSNGTASLSAQGLLTYTPANGFVGTDELQYEVCIDGCAQSCSIASFKITIQSSDCQIPNIITPNEDGMNDTFIVPCAENHPENEIMIFNRWGDKVFSALKYKNDWDGTYRGNELPPGTYFYLYKSDPNTQSEQSGFITLVR